MFAVAAIAYLPLAHQFDFLKDDWYLMFDAHVGGGNIFHRTMMNLCATITKPAMQAP